jgi:hypothetical protein
MRAIKQLMMFGILAATVGACFEAPEFPIEPRIEFEDMIYKRVDGIDSLIFLISFTDGNGDLGLADSDTGCSLAEGENTICFQNTVHEIYQSSLDPDSFGLLDTGVACDGTSKCFTSKFTMLKPDLTAITYEDRRTNPDYSSLPDIVKPFNCINWQFPQNGSNQTDTLFTKRNPDHNNFDLDFLVKNPNGTFTEFDFTKEYDFPNCGISFDGRFPILFSNEPGSPLEGTIRFGIGSPFLRTQFSLKTLKFRIVIKDRALNESNELFTPEITF